jgi:PTS system nitrogen regulatory IIA component
MNSLDSLLNPQRVVCQLPAASKKRVLELVAQHIADVETSLDVGPVYASLLERERLGSTALGTGVAVPHCRVRGLDKPLGCLVTLASPIDYDAPDGKPVDLLFVLLVPPSATQEHLDLLAEVARRFSDSLYCEGLRKASSAVSLLQSATTARAA